MKMIFQCKTAIGFLSEIVDGRASFWQRVQFYMHLMMCGKCRLYFRQFKEVKALAEQDPFPIDKLPDDFFEVMEDSMQSRKS
ncbi:MAG TPA: hypothetical protein DCE42_29800 [Myxococcales bacterium]|nr:hypothetical protein [Deltaproteobacteria bacterium]HAA58986.1 hypothetical protein [Myxococcales bacterium]|tara:strand:+ start:15118 stop:15363 length:246 start_codon:yes stop_codon:yes gene_type:complete